MGSYLNWYIRTGEGETLIQSNSGIGFYGPQGYGYPIHTGNYNDSTYIIESTDYSKGPEGVNNRYIAPTAVWIWQSSDFNHVNRTPNSKAIIHLQFSSAEISSVNNVWVTASKRYTPASYPDLSVYLCELCNSSEAYESSQYSFQAWSGVSGSSGIFLRNNPGENGSAACTGGTVTSYVHDWYLMCSVSPTSGGSLDFAIYAQLEYA